MTHKIICKQSKVTHKSIITKIFICHACHNQYLFYMTARSRHNEHYWKWTAQFIIISIETMEKQEYLWFTFKELVVIQVFAFCLYYKVCEKYLISLSNSKTSLFLNKTSLRSGSYMILVASYVCMYMCP